MENTEFTLAMAQEFHQHIAKIVSAVQAGIWQAGREELIGYDSDFGFGQKRGIQTLVLKTRSRSAYLRLDWDTLSGAASTAQRSIDEAVSTAINTLA